MRQLFLHFLMLSFILGPGLILAQVSGLCPDGQGINVLTDGDFGFGSSNVLPTDPGIAPGYQYTASPPPDDGFYTITNDMSPWGSFATNWIDIRDNSTDPEGYMMVVNASFEPGVFYEQTVDICSGSTYEFSADIINIVEPTVPHDIFPNIDFLVDGVVMYSTGNIPQDGLWKTFGFVFTAAPGQNSVRIEIRNNAPGGQGNDLAIDNISFAACGPQVELSTPDFVCAGSTDTLIAILEGGQYSNPFYQWQISSDGSNWTDIAGANEATLFISIYENSLFRLLVSDGASNISLPTCRVVSNSAFVQIEGFDLYDTVAMCTGEYILFDDKLITQPGDYVAQLTSRLGCDSIVHLHVDEFNSNRILLTDTLCYGTPYNGIIYEESVTIVDSLVNRHGCDSVVTTNLFVDNIDLVLPSNVVIDQGATFLLQAEYSGNIVQWNWSPDTFITCTDCPVTTVNPPLTQRFYLEAFSENGCFDSTSVLVNVLIEKNIYVPTAFSPNDDGINDKFTFYANQNIRHINEFHVYDRWGSKVYGVSQVSPQSPLMEWDGTINDKEAISGVYVYSIVFTAIDGTMESISGDVLLLR